MKCSVNNCPNDTQTLQKGHGVTFHNFPWFRNNWREVLAMDDEPNADSLVCSDHFRREDIYVTKGGHPKIRVGALPLRIIQVCRICLATDVKMYSIRDRQLQQAYADVCGFIIEEDKRKDKLPEKLCWECTARLLAGFRLRNRAIKSHQLLTQLLLTTPCITQRAINTINRSENDLESNLSLRYNEPDDCDLYIDEGVLNKTDVDDVIMEIEEIESFGDDIEEEYLEESNLVDVKFDSDHDLKNDDFEEEYLEESSVFEEKYDSYNDMINECELNYRDGEENENEYEDDGSRVLKGEANISDDEYKYYGRNELNHSDVEQIEEENEEGNYKRRVLKEEGNNSDDDEYDDEEQNYLNDSDENYEDIKTIVETRKSNLKVKTPKNFTGDDEYGDDGRNDLNDSDENFEDKVSTVKTRKSNLKVKTPKNIIDDDEYDDDGRNDLNNSDENIIEIGSTVKKRKSNLIVTTPKIKKSEARDKTKSSRVEFNAMFTVTSLSLEEQLEDAQRRRDLPRNKHARYRCDVCGIGFKKINRYEMHVERHSELAGEYQCVVCATRLKSEAALKKHQSCIHSRRYSCKRCPFVTLTSSMANHHQYWHEGEKFQCKHCPSRFTHRSSYLGHLRYKHRADFICELCGFTFLSERGVTIHKNLLHRFIDKQMKLEGPYCEACDVTFMSEEAHDRHLKVTSRHSNQSTSNEILNDPQSAYDKASRKREGRRATTDKDGTSENEELVTCEQCGKEFPGYRLYAQHFWHNHREKMRTQFSGKSDTVMCDQCGRVFKNGTILRYHMPTHTGKKLFECSFCNRKFVEKSELAEHCKINNHTGELRLDCGKCGKTFSKKSTFQAHLKTHVRHDCNICGKVFIHAANRKRHMWTHAAQKPVKCTACDKTFANPSVQKWHFKYEHLKKPWPKRKKDLPPDKRRMRAERRAPVED